MSIDTAETCTRLLEAAATVFAEHGYAATTIRMICGRAKVNVAAVNYHFGSKEGLYREVLRYVRQCAYEKYPPTFGLTANATPEEKLHAFVRSLLLRTLSDERNLCYGKLMMREMVEPTGALDMLVKEGIRSLVENLVDIVRLLLGDDAPIELVQSSSMSIMGQCLLYLCGRSIIIRIAPAREFTPKEIDTISQQIVTFSLSALNVLKAKPQTQR